MKYYTETISVPLAEKLKEKGMPVEIVCDNTVEHSFPPEYHCETMFCEILDWLMSEKEIEISFVHHFRTVTIAGTMETSHEYYHANISMLNGGLICYEMGNTWHEAAEAAIEKALTLI